MKVSSARVSAMSDVRYMLRQHSVCKFRCSQLYCDVMSRNVIPVLGNSYNHPVKWTILQSELKKKKVILIL